MSYLKREEAFDQWFSQLTLEQQVPYARDTDRTNSHKPDKLNVKRGKP